MPGIAVLPMGGLYTNCCVVDDGGECVVIDPADNGRRIFEYIEKRGLRCSAVLLTHGHPDHTGGLKELIGLTGAKLYMGEGDVYRSPVKPDRTVTDGEVIKAGGMSFTAVTAPGHTEGGVCYILGDTMFSGDTLFRDSVGRTDLPGGDYPTLRRTLIKLRDLPYSDLTVIPGHGETTTLEYERRNNPFIEKGEG